MKAYKFLLPGAIGPFSGFAWPVGARVEAGTSPSLCRTAVHGCLVEHLPWWIQEELWEADLAEPVRLSGHKVMAPAGRLVRRIDAWDGRAMRDFAGACALRAADRAAEALERAGAADEARALRACSDAEAVRSVTRALRPPAAARIGVTMAADGASRALAGHAATSAYIGAHAARNAAGPAAMAQERRWQSAWLADRLGL